MIQQLGAETVGLLAAVQEDAVLRHALGAEIIADRTHRQHQIIIADAVPAHDLAPVLIHNGRDQHVAAVAIYPVHDAIEEAIAPGMPVAAITDFVEIGVQGAGRHFVQQRLPDMGAVLFHQQDVEPVAPEALAQLGGQFQPRRAAADHHNLRFARLAHAATDSMTKAFPASFFRSGC